MDISFDFKEGVVLRKVYNGVRLEQPDGNSIGICMRDDTFEISIIPKGSDKAASWWRVDMGDNRIMPL